MTQIESDNRLIAALGGPAAVARLLGLQGRHAVQRVSNWRIRGVPSDVKIQHPEVFLRHLMADSEPNPPIPSVERSFSATESVAPASHPASVAA